MLSVSILVAFVLLSAILQVTSPSTIHPAGILLVYVLFYVLALGAFTFFLVGASSVLVGIGVARERLGITKAYYFASVLALAPVILLAMKSIGRLAIYEILLIIIFECIAIIYVSRRY